ncbi:MAG: MBL fold metallo-hydrolase [Muribaculaceae bacterium]|nr:MBL fold metallo-hydrolase [Muribaculaceae bacterium]
MAYKRNRRSTRQLDDLPGLFDEVDSEFKAPDPLQAIVKEHRAKQASARPGQLEIDEITGVVALRRQLQFFSVGSGSSGNCAYLGVAGEGGIVIDAGVDPDKLLNELRRNGIDPDKVAGIVLTHDHGDHVKFAYALLRKLPNTVVYCTPRTLEGMLRRHSVSRRIKDRHKPVYKEFAFEAGPFMVTPFEVSHDGSDNVGFCVTVGDKNFVVATDMGMIGERADFYIRKANWLMIESNYDAAMLATGRYPEYLKARIRSDHGHLNNTVTADYLAQMWRSWLTDVYLCHLSEDNNRPELALRVVGDALRAKGITVGDGSGSVESRRAQVRVSALPRYDASPLFVHRI